MRKGTQEHAKSLLERGRCGHISTQGEFSWVVLGMIPLPSPRQGGYLVFTAEQREMVLRNAELGMATAQRL